MSEDGQMNRQTDRQAETINRRGICINTRKKGPYKQMALRKTIKERNRMKGMNEGKEEKD